MRGARFVEASRHGCFRPDWSMFSRFLRGASSTEKPTATGRPTEDPARGSRGPGRGTFNDLDLPAQLRIVAPRGAVVREEVGVDSKQVRVLQRGTVVTEERLPAALLGR